MITHLETARSLLSSAHGLLNEEAHRPQLAPHLTKAAAMLTASAITELQAALSAHPAATLGDLDVLGATAGAAADEPYWPAYTVPIPAHRDAPAATAETDIGLVASGLAVPVDVVSADLTRANYLAAAPAESEPVVWTQARCDHLAAAVPRGDEWNDILLALNAMPGATTVASVGAAKAQANKLGLQRPEGWTKARASEGGRKGGLARAAAGIPMPNQVSPCWNEARDAVVIEHWPAGADSAWMLALINAIPHEKPVLDAARLAERAAKLGVKRSPEYHAAILAKRTAQMMAAKPTVWTVERLALIEAEYATAEDLGDLFNRICVLPGPAPTSVAGMSAVANKRGWHRRGPAVVEKHATPPRKESSAQSQPMQTAEPVPPSALPPIPAMRTMAAMPAMRPMDPIEPVAPVDPEISHTKLLATQEKARRMLREGSEPAIVQMHCKSLPLREVLRLAGEVRQERRAAASTHQSEETPA